MAKYRRKPLIIEAFRFTRESILAEGDGEKLPDWVQKRVKVIMRPDKHNVNQESLVINTPLGDRIMLQGDWLIKGDAFPYKPSEFEGIYEPVEDNPQLPDDPEDIYGSAIYGPISLIHFKPPQRLTLLPTDSEEVKQLKLQVERQRKLLDNTGLIKAILADEKENPE